MEETILLVDDEEGIRKVLSLSLRDAGYKVLTAANGAEALEVFRSDRPPIVLTDIKMPGLDGIELLKRIKAVSPETEVIMITGHGDMDLAIKSLKYEATDFVTKPIHHEVLEIALRRAKEKIYLRRALKEYTENLEALVREKSERLIRAERQAAASQVVEGLATALRGIAADLEGGLTFFNELPCFVAIHNRDLKVVAVNQLFRQRLGDLVGADSWAVYRGRSSSPHGCPVGRTFAAGKGLRCREVAFGAGQVEMPVIVHTAPIRAGDTDVDLVLEIAADMTEVRRLQEELEDTQARYQRLFDEAPCCIAVLDRDYNLLAANRRLKDEFGASPGDHCFAAYLKRDRPCVDCPAAATFQDGRPHQSEMIVTSRSGRPHTFLISTAAMSGAGGEITQVMEMCTDITQVRELEDHLSHLGLLIGSISHGIKGLLTGLDGGMYLVNSGFLKENQEQIKDGWETVKLMVGRIRSMVLDILYYAKERDLKWERTDVLSLAAEVALAVEPKLLGRNIEFEKRFEPGLGQCEVDPGVIRSALINILENAVEACLEDGAKPSHRVVLAVSREEEHILFDIQDNGRGMDQRTRDNLFTLFFSSKGSRGTGLGLFISHRIIQQHGGTIEVTSTPSQGSRFRIRLPQYPQESFKTAKRA
ncbi:MAG: response regulator [Thermodesulfobacteriota bacterium]